FVTHDADHAAVAVDRRVEERRDAERLEIGRAELLGDRILARVGRGDGAPLVERAEVDREVGRAQHGALRVLVARALVDAIAADRAPLLDRQPYADALDGERAGR